MIIFAKVQGLVLTSPQKNNGSVKTDPYNKDKLNNIDWVVLGAESGENARYCDFEWLFDIVAVCYNENIPVFLNNYCDSNGVVTDEVDNENLRVEPFKLQFILEIENN